MNMRIWLLATACATTLCASPSVADGGFHGWRKANEQLRKKTEKNAVTKLDGTKLFGFIEVTDDYTIRISNDSGITRLPIAQLGDADFQKYGFQKDRSKDGRFWYERKEALQSSQEDHHPQRIRNPMADQKSGERSPVEIRLGEIAAFQPFIAAYEKTLASKSSEKSMAQSSRGASKPDEKSDDSDIHSGPCFPSQVWEVRFPSLSRD